MWAEFSDEDFGWAPGCSEIAESSICDEVLEESRAWQAMAVRERASSPTLSTGGDSENVVSES